MPKRGKKEAAEGETPKKVASRSSPEDPSTSYVDPPLREVTSSGRGWSLKVTSWNVDGLRAWVKKGGIEWVESEAPQVLCLQETKCGGGAVPPEFRSLRELLPHQFWASSQGRPGYAGVGLLAKDPPLSVTYGIGDPSHDSEGRVITAEFPSLYVVSAYVPNAGRGLVRLERRRAWDSAFLQHLTRLDALKPLVLAGDLNVAHGALDLRHPKANARSPGFTREEREGFDAILGAGFLDSFRHLYPEARNAFTFWTYLGGARQRNVGWRLDYFVLSQRLEEALCDSKIRNEVMGSDHCPISLYLAV
ncbi:DNA repair nuclease/redox regulator APEX1 isoform X1 [Heliangelus exortis]|uniref:DNA repair nuclease/redox regulator APEX1 isoform X1 n=1 Tax=Heliangelus exortis TaxID=472823 RepID=UPI003A95942C